MTCVLLGAVGLIVGGCAAPAREAELRWQLGPGGMEAFRRDRAACQVEVEIVRAPYLAADDPVFGRVAALRTWAACMAGRGHVLEGAAVASASDPRARARGACLVAAEKVFSPFMARDNPVEGKAAARRAYTACMEARGFTDAS